MAKYYRETKKRTYDRNLTFVREYKENCGCTDCKIKFPHYVLDFDHLDGKQSEVSRLAGSRYSLEKIMVEIKKCEVVCGNCHKVRTWNRAHP
jgi:hypothetical protein